MDYTIKIGGEAGQGVQTVGATLARVFARSGYHVFTFQDYESRIRGGHNFYQIRVADRVLTTFNDSVDIIVAFDRESVDLHQPELSERGQIIYDSTSLGIRFEAASFLDVPMEALSLEHGGSKIMSNVVATGAVIGMLGMDLDVLMGIIKDTFGSKGDEVVEANIAAAMAGYDFAVKGCLKCAFSAAETSGAKMLINGIDAISLGALSAGCKFYAAYPMTPSTGVMVHLATRARQYGVVVEQAEDEIAAINMAIGASFAGVRAMTGTSGGGFALMVEGLSLAGMTETPVVVALGQRPGPATGFPTRTEQGDLSFALSAGHGEFPRVILTPGTPEEGFNLTNKAFDIAEKYQIPVIVVFDHYLADSEWTCEAFDLSKLKYTDYRVRGDTLHRLTEYKRYALTGSGISPLAVPGDSRHLVVADSDEHSEEGHIVEDAPTRVSMVTKRFLKKLALIRREMDPPSYYGADNPDIVLVGWGSTFGVIRDVVSMLSDKRRIGMLHFSEVYPLPSCDRFDYLSLLKRARLTLCVENNASGQFARLVRSESGFAFSAEIHKFDGRPFSSESLIGEINAHIGRL